MQQQANLTGPADDFRLSASMTENKKRLMVSENSSSQAATKKRILVADRKADESKRKKLAAELDKKKKILFSPSLPAPRQGMDCRERAVTEG